jgi:hypothetical protein
MKRSAEPTEPAETNKTSQFDWPALSLFFLLATAFWIPPLPTSVWSLPAALRVAWLSMLLVASYVVLFRRRPSGA